jgi:TonB family protein
MQLDPEKYEAKDAKYKDALSSISGVDLRSSFSVSVLLHCLFFLMCAVLISKRTAQISPKNYTIVEVEPLPEALKKRSNDDLKTKNQVVQTEKAKQTDTAVPDAFLGEHNQVVDRESVSKNRNTVMQHTGRQAQTQTNPAQAEAAKQVSKQKPQPQIAAVPNLGNLAVPIVPKYQPKTLKKMEEEARNDNWADQGAAPQDYVQGYHESDRTLLNTKEYLFYGYYQRIRQRLDSAWVPILKARLVRYYNSGRHLASEMEHRTKVLVVMNGDGAIVRVELVSESGTNDLDEAAIDAFNEAGPFPNPPKGIVNKSGQIEIPWEFILHT